MSGFAHSVGGQTWRFDSLREVMAKASPARSGDRLAGVAAGSDAERVAAQMALADIPLKRFLDEALIPYESDEVTRLIIDTHDRQAFAPVSHLTVGGLRDWLLDWNANRPAELQARIIEYERARNAMLLTVFAELRPDQQRKVRERVRFYVDAMRDLSASRHAAAGEPAFASQPVR